MAAFLFRYPTEPVSIDRAEEEDEENRKEEHKTESARPPKRRSKNDQNGRSYKCGCGKMYLSYPALYTHIKTKHDMVQPAGTYGPQFRNGRGRGRPRKMKDTTEPAPVQQTHPSDNIRKNPNFADEISFVREIGEYADNPTDPLQLCGIGSFPIVYERNQQVEHPLMARVREVREHAEKTIAGEYVRRETCADYALAVFLWEHSLVCKPEFYKYLVHLVTALHKFLTDEVECEYTRNHDPGDIPQYSNEFMSYLKSLAEKMNEDRFTQVWKHFCEWLYVHGYTPIRLESKN